LFILRNEKKVGQKQKKMSKSIIAFIIVAVTLVAGTGCNRYKEERKSVGKSGEAITIGVVPQPITASLYVAYEMGFFTRNGLNPTLQSYASGKDALDAVISGKLQFAIAAETPFMLAILAGKRITIVCTCADADNYGKIIARKDMGIRVPADLKDKKIGVNRGTNWEFYLHVFLIINHMLDEEVLIINVPTDRTVEALETGQVAAIVAAAPYWMTLREQLGSNALVLSEPEIYTVMANIVVSQAFEVNNPEIIKKFLQAVIEANDFIQKHPAETRAIITRTIIMDRVLLDEIWESLYFEVKLDQSLILNLEDQARWMLKKERGSNRKLPNFMDFISTRELASVKPEAVRMGGN
jgi:NitT/TauT family transport system substrate-binding protein